MLANHIDVIYSPDVRACVKPGCSDPARATVGLRYDERVVWVRDLLPEQDPNLLDLCGSHADRLTPPRGWNRVDDRSEDESSQGQPAA